MIQHDAIDIHRAYRRVLIPSKQAEMSAMALTVLTDLLDECGVFDVCFQIGGNPADNGYLAGRRSIGMIILERLGITDLRKISAALGEVLPEEVEEQEIADGENKNNGGML